MKLLRTPDERFRDLEGYPFAPHYVELSDGPRMHYVDEGPRDGRPILMLHGEPTWSYLYRKMIPAFAGAGYRALAPDLVGFGKSDKPASPSDYTYARHVAWMREWLLALDLTDVTLICQDWGSLVGLRLAMELGGARSAGGEPSPPDKLGGARSAGGEPSPPDKLGGARSAGGEPSPPENTSRFARIVVANGFLPTADRPVPPAFRIWRRFSMHSPLFPIGRIVASGCVTKPSRAVVAAYDAPFPSSSYKAGARIFPSLVPTRPDDPAVPANRAAWAALGRWEKPFLTLFGKNDPILGRADAPLQAHVPGAKGQPHERFWGGHFVQEDRGEYLAERILAWLASSS